MTNIPLVSVIIPMYNAERHVKECLDSLFEQTFQDFEVIVINDSSTDKSPKIVEGYKEKFNGRLKFYSNEKNLGASASRNKGLFFSRGEYIFFMDADDMLMLNALEDMYTFAKKFNADVVECTKNYKTNEDSKEIILVDPDDSKISEISFLLEETLPSKIESLFKNKVRFNVWLKLLRRDFLIENELFFLENVEYAEDKIWSQGVLFCAKKIFYLPRAYYFYRIAKNSIIRKKRNVFQIINIRLRAVINGLRWLDDIMGKIEFFKQNPQFRHKVLDHFTRKFYRGFFKRTIEIPPSEIYESIKQEFGRDFDENDVLIPALCTFVNTQQKKIDTLKNKIKAKQSKEET